MANCPYCRKYFSLKKDAVAHIEKYHSRELEASGMDAAQSLYFSVHGKLTGKCQCGCGKDTEWCMRTGKPYKVSPDPECRARLRKIAQANLMNARGIDQHTLMSDMEHQKEMQKNRKISGKYTFKTDGGTVEYMGKLELNWLKFCDTVLDLPSRCIQDPPQNFTYYDSKDKVERTYMPDFYMPDYNLIVEIKDGGDHPNGNPKFIEETKYKVAMKDEMMKKQTNFNYIRISGTNYGPFLEALYQIVHEQKDDDKKRKAVIVITESACSEPMEDIDWSQDEEIDVDRIRLIVGYIEGSNMPAYCAITDSRIGAYWYVTDMLNLRFYQASHDDKIFTEGGYRIYKYAGNRKDMQDAFRDIVSLVSIGNERYDNILSIMGRYGICFDDGIGYANNLIKRSNFILLEEYFMPLWTIGGEEE